MTILRLFLNSINLKNNVPRNKILLRLAEFMIILLIEILLLFIMINFKKITTVMKVGLGKDGNDNDYIARFMKNENLAKFSIFHELGHFLNGDFDNLNPNNDEIRKNYIRNGEVQPSELKADEFALRQLKRQKNKFERDNRGN